MSDNLISIIIPTYNRSIILLETIHSILNQSYKKWECLIVDDGSESSFFTDIKRVIDADVRFKLIERSAAYKKGGNSCRNIGMLKANGTYLMFLDSDDILKRHCLESRLKEFKSHTHKDFLVFQSELFNKIPGDLNKIPNLLFKQEDDLSRFINFDYPWNVSACIFKNSFLNDSKITWDESLSCHQDLDFYIHILCRGANYLKSSQIPDVYIRMGQENKLSNHSNIVKKHFDSKLRYLKNIQSYLLKYDLWEKYQKVFYANSIRLAHFFKQENKIEFISEIAIVNNKPTWFLKQDVNFYNSKKKSFWTLITNANKRLEYLNIDNTLAHYRVSEEKHSHLNIVHIVTSVSGGAGIAAYRLHKGLVALGIPSKVLALHKNDSKLEEVYYYKNLPKTLWEKAARKLYKKPHSIRNKELLIDKKGNHEGFSIPRTDYKVHLNPIIENADIIHLHWVSGFLDFPSFFKHVKKPIVWTLHDMNPFQGGFHYKDDEIRNDTVYGELDAHIKRLKKKAYQNSGLHSIVSPSKWMLEASKKSELLSVFPHIQIANGIDSEVFNILDKKSVRDSLGLPLDKSIFLFVSESLDNKRKQFNVLLDAFSQMKRTDFMLIAVGVIPSDRKSNIHYIGTVKDETKMVELYNAADAFILPSAEDNLPNVMLESLMCGTPVIATPVGGMNEVIEHGINGYLTSEDNAIALKKVLDHFLDTQHTFDREVIRKLAVEKFEITQQAEVYKNLYKAIVSKLN